MQIKNICGGALFATRNDTPDSLLPEGRAFVPEPYKQRPLWCVAGRNPFFNFSFSFHGAPAMACLVTRVNFTKTVDTVTTELYKPLSLQAKTPNASLNLTMRGV